MGVKQQGMVLCQGHQTHPGSHGAGHGHGPVPPADMYSHQSEGEEGAREEQLLQGTGGFAPC